MKLNLHNVFWNIITNLAFIYILDFEILKSLKWVILCFMSWKVMNVRYFNNISEIKNKSVSVVETFFCIHLTFFNNIYIFVMKCIQFSEKNQSNDLKFSQSI